jgi:LytS/YehU family sensor histidine kinase
MDVFQMRENLMGQWEAVNCMIDLFIALIIVFISYKDNKYLFKYYMVAFSVLIILIPLYAFEIPNEYLVKAATIIEMITLSFAVSQRFKLTENHLKLKKEQELILNNKVKQLEMDMRKAQMNPNFMTNALTSIEYFILSNNSVQARDYLKKFSRLMRLTLDHSRNNFVTLCDELEALKLYLELEFLRLQQHEHNFEVRVANTINTQGILVPPLLIQPLVENVIWHELQYRENGCTLQVDIVFTDNRLMCTIGSNGIGGSIKSISKNHTSPGISITKERLTLIHAILNSVDKFEIEDNDEPPDLYGTVIRFNLPYVSGDF